MGVVLLYCMQMSYRLKFCRLNGCVAVCRGKRMRQFIYGYICMAVVLCRLCCAETAKISQALEDA